MTDATITADELVREHRHHHQHHHHHHDEKETYVPHLERPHKVKRIHWKWWVLLAAVIIILLDILLLR